MARFAYDVNTRTRYIDVHKQFNGGLKTVDTDDALGAVYLRQAENVSLSEFGFLEKRYGTFEKELIKTTSGKLQGYWEYMGFAIFVVDGTFYYKGTGDAQEIEYLYQEIQDKDAPETIFLKKWRYPNLTALNFTSASQCNFYETTETVESETNPNQSPSSTPCELGFSYLSGCTETSSGSGQWVCTRTSANIYTEYDADFPTNIEMGAVNINNVLYIFTGKYPVYIKIVNNVPKMYLFSVTIPTYDEIVVTGHNLLENNYDDVYEFDGSNVSVYAEDFQNTTGPTVNSDNTESIKSNFKIRKSNYFPEFPYVDEVEKNDAVANKINFEFAYKRWENIADGNSENIKYELMLSDVFFAPAGTSDLDKFTKISSDSITSSLINLNSSTNIDVESIFDFYPNSNTVIFETVGNGSRYTFTEDFIKDYTAILQYRDSSQNIISNQEADNTSVHIVQSDGVLKELEVNTITIDGTEYAYFNIPSELFSENSQQFTIRVSNTELSHGSSNHYSEITYKLAKFYHPRTAAFGATLFNASVTNLLAGFWDFKFKFRLYYNNNDFVEREHTIFNINITPEKLQDFPGITDDFLPKLKPIWTCNRVIEHYGKLMVWGSTEMPTAIFYSFPDRPTYFPSKFYLDFTNDTNQKIEAVTPFMNILVAQTASQTFGIRGNSGIDDSPAPYVPFGINPTVGTIAYKSVRPVRNQLFFLSKQGLIALTSLYAVDETYNIKFVDRNIRNIVPQETGAVGIQFDNQYWLNFPEERITLRWYIDKKAWVKDVYQGYAENAFNGVFKYQIRDGKLEFITNASTQLGEGENQAIYKIGIDNELPTDLTEGIKSKFETSFLNQNYPFHQKNYKEAKLDFTLQNEYNKSQGFIYEMDYDEDLDSTSVHIIDNATIIPNHYYRIKYNFEPHNPPVLDAGSFADDYDDEIDGGTFTTQPGDSLVGILENDDYDMSTFDHLTISDVFVRDYENINTLIPVNNLTINASTGEVTFQVPNFVRDNQIDIEVQGDFTNYTNGADITNITFDDSLTFKSWIISENQTLNLDNIDSYDQSKAEVGFNLGTRLGTWVFGTSDFGDKITAVKTIKLSGKGYNSKLYLEDFSKSKWTLESIGLTYKMKRARSR